MRRQKKITLELDSPNGVLRKDIIVYELTVKKVYEVINGLAGIPTVNSLLIKANEWLPSMTDLKTDEITDLDLAPSDLKTIFDAFQEVNAVFFDLLKSSGLFDVIGTALRDEVKTRFGSELQKASVPSSSEDTGKPVGTTDGPSSSKPLNVRKRS